MNNLYKYPRTPHMPFSKGATKDDRVLTDMKHFIGKQIVITEKMDGENTTIYSNYYHARSLSSKHQKYHSYLLSNILPQIQYLLPENIHICGEYLYAKHSIFYENLPSYFLVFSIWNDKECFSWEETKEYCKKWNLIHVPELYIGTYDEKKVKEIAENVITKGGEGIVIRTVDSFSYDDFSLHVAKYVREGHVQTDKHWSLQAITTNKLEETHENYNCR